MSDINNISVYDFDGTMIKFPEDHVWTGDSFNWPNFISYMRDAEPIMEVVDQFCLDLRSDTINPIIVTARPVEYIRETMNKLMELCGYPTFKNVPIIARAQCMVDLETDDLAELNDQDDVSEEMVKDIIHDHHKHYREAVIEGIVQCGQTVERVYDDQKANLDAFANVCKNLLLVDNDTVVEYVRD